MANTAQARKRARQAEKHRQHNASQRSEMRTYIKKVRAAINANQKDEANKALADAMPVIDRMVKRGLIHKNAAARYKSRLNSHIRAL